MSVSTTLRAAAATIRVVGRFDFSRHREFRTAVKEALANPTVREIEIDLSAATYVDSAALGMLLLSRENAVAVGKEIVLLRPAATVRQVLDVANFQKLFVYRDA